MPKPRGITLILVALASLVLLAWRYHSWWLALILFVPALAVAVRRNRPRWWSIHNGYMRCVAAAAGARRGASLPPDPTATARSALALFRQGWESSDVAITLESAQAMMAEASFVESLKAALRRRGPSLAEHDVARFAQRGADTFVLGPASDPLLGYRCGAYHPGCDRRLGGVRGTAGWAARPAGACLGGRHRRLPGGRPNARSGR